MTPKEIGLVEEDTLFGPSLKLGSKKECAICGSKIMCLEVITVKSKAKKSHSTFFCCKSCIKNLNKIKKNLISEEYFIKNLKKLKRFKSIIFVDIETTGMMDTGGEIIEIGALKYNLDKKLNVSGIFFQRIKPETDYFDPNAMEVNGIKPEDLINAPVSKEVIPKFKKFLDGSLCVAHRAHFDMGFLNHYFDKFEISRPKNSVLDTFKIGKRLYGKAVRLDGLLKNNKIRIPFSRHKSWIDCLTTSEVFFKMVRWYKITELHPIPFSAFEYHSLKEV